MISHSETDKRRNNNGDRRDPEQMVVEEVNSVEDICSLTLV